MSKDFFSYGKKELDYLKSKNVRLKEVIDCVGMIKRPVVSNLFTALVFSIVGQQISSKAQESIWNRMCEGIGKISAKSINRLSLEELKSYGISLKKAQYIKNAAAKIMSGEFDILALDTMSDDEVIEKLTSLDGVGVWTAEMLMIFSMKRENILSFGDFAIQRGLRMIFRHRKITRKLFEKYKRMFSPYCSMASFYIWEISGGAYEGYKDLATKTKR